MTTVLFLQALRCAPGNSRQQALQNSSDLGRLTHVQKVLSKTFAAGRFEGPDFVWSSPPLAISAQPEQVDRPRFIRFKVSGEGITRDALIAKISPRLRRLAEDRAWAFFEDGSDQALLLAPPKRAPRRMKGLVTITIEPNELLSDLASHGQGRFLVIGGLRDVSELDEFLDITPPPEQMAGQNGSLRWTNVEVRLADGTRFFPVYFRGQIADILFDWYKSAASTAGLLIGSIVDTTLRIDSGAEPTNYDLEDCHLFSHNIWETSIATRH